jgi:hypothetical protein
MLRPTRRDAKTMMLMGAANWAARRYGGRSTGTSRAMTHATWALPLGMMLADHLRNRRAR